MLTIKQKRITILNGGYMTFEYTFEREVTQITIITKFGLN